MCPWTPVYQQLRDTGDLPSDASLSWLFITVIGVTVATSLLESYLAYRDVVYLEHNPDLSRELRIVLLAIDKKEEQQDRGQTKPPESIMSRIEANYQQSVSYTRERHFYVTYTVMAIAKLALALLGYQPYMWDLACYLGARLAGWNETDNPIVISLIFAAIIKTVHSTKILILLDQLAYMPVKRMYGLTRNDVTRWSYVMTSIKSDVSRVVGLAPMLALGLLVIQVVGDYSYIALWMGWVYYSAIWKPKRSSEELQQPLSNVHFKARIVALAERANYPLGNVLVASSSLPSSKVSLPVIQGIPHIKLHESLLKEFSEEEVLALIGHELGLWKLQFVLSQVHIELGLGLFWFSLGRRDVFAAFGFNDPDRPIPALVAISVVYGLIWTPISKILRYGMNALSRKRIFAADQFVADMGLSRPLQVALCKLHLGRRNLEVHRMAPISAGLTSGHPSLTKRIKALMAQEQQRKLD